jgi:hypothetical protein
MGIASRAARGVASRAANGVTGAMGATGAMGPRGWELEPRANVAITTVSSGATGAIAFGLLGAAATAALPIAAAGAVAFGAAALGGVAGVFLGKRINLGEPDVLVRHPDGALYITVKFNPKDGHNLEHAVEEVRRYARERANVLYFGIRRIDQPGHPYVVQWQRKTATEAFGTGEWLLGADEEQRKSAPPSIDQLRAHVCSEELSVPQIVVAEREAKDWPLSVLDQELRNDTSKAALLVTSRGIRKVVFQPIAGWYTLDGRPYASLAAIAEAIRG